MIKPSAVFKFGFNGRVIVALAVMAVTYVLTASVENLALLLASRIVIAAALYVGLMKLLRSKTLEECIKFRL